MFKKIFNMLYSSSMEDINRIFNELDRERDADVLRLFCKSITRQNIELKKEVDKQKLIEAKMNQFKLAIFDQLTTFRKLIFGKKSEKMKSDVNSRPRESEDTELLLHGQRLVPAPKEEELLDLEKVEIQYEINGKELLDESRIRGFKRAKLSDWEEIHGLFEESREITIEERKYKVTVHKRKKYRFKPSTSEKQIIITAKGPDKLLPGCKYSIDLALSVVGDKYLLHLPLERQRKEMERLGLSGVGVKTLYNLALGVAIHHEKVVEDIKDKDIFEANIAAHCDETPWSILNKKDDDGYMWCISNQAGSYYQFEPSRSGKVIEEMLKGYKGPVLSDGYQGYGRLKNLKDITLANCWSHGRRKFFEIKDNYPKECDEILVLMKHLFSIERKAKDFNELKLLRQNESKPIVDKIREWLFEKKSLHLPESGFTKAVDYMLKYWKGLTLFLADTRVPLTNNDVERALRHSVLGRKNFYGSKSINGADVAAILYTVIESCKKVELDPVSYMKYVILTNNKDEKPLTPLKYAKSIRPDKSTAL